MLLKQGGNEITDEQTIAQEMNLYFASVFTQEQSILHEFGNIISDRLRSLPCAASEVGLIWSRLASWKNVHKNCLLHYGRYLNQNQFGYLKGKSTLAHLLSCFQDWSLSRNSLKTLAPTTHTQPTWYMMGPYCYGWETFWIMLSNALSESLKVK